MTGKKNGIVKKNGGDEHNNSNERMDNFNIKKRLVGGRGLEK
jgi:hypothetical protein